MNHSIRVGLALILLFGIGAATHAVPIAGSFAGRADIDVIDFIPGDGIFDAPLLDIPIRGTLAFDTELGPDVQPQPIEGGVELLFQPFVLTFTFELLPEQGPQTFTFSSVPLVTLREDGIRQSISFQTLEFFESATLELGGSSRSLFSSFDLGTFNSAAIDPVVSSARFNLPRFLSGSVRLNEVRFDGAGNVDVAEPAQLALMLAGLPLLCFILRLRRTLLPTARCAATPG